MIPKEWTESVGQNFTKFFGVMSSLDTGGFFSMFEESMSEKVVKLAEALVSLADYFNKSNVKFDVKKMPSLNWSAGFSTAIGAVIPGLNYISENNGLFGGGGAEKLTSGVTAIASSITKASQILARGRWDVVIPSRYIIELQKNLGLYVELTKFLNQSDVDNEDLTDFADSMVRLAEAYEKLGDSLKKLKGDLDGMDMEKMTTLKNLSGSIVMLSLMDSTQFESMMDALESKAKIFVDLMNNTGNSSLEKAEPSVVPLGVGGGKATNTTTEVRNKTQTKEEKMDQLLTALQSSLSGMGASLDAIANVVAASENPNSLSKYIASKMTAKAGSLYEGSITR
jgi:hypothetical protein